MRTKPQDLRRVGVSRRQFVASAAAAAIGASARGATPESHTVLRAGDLTAVIGGNAVHEEHRAGYNGVWSLRHAKGARSVFVPTVAGLNLEHIVTGEHLEDSRTFFEPRNSPMTLVRLTDTEAELHQPLTPAFYVESWTRFRVDAPHYLDMDFRCRAHRDVFPRGYLSLFWASYMNAPADKSVYFLGGLDAQKGMWTQFCTQWHNDQSTVRHRDDRFEMTFPTGGRDALFKSLSRFRFDRPFFYGHFDDLVWIVMFDRSEGIRFTHSPSGGGENTEFMTTNPAWDFQFLIQKPEVMKDYGFKVRTVLRPKCSRDDILAEFNRWKPQP
ncbi:hypothetical protein FJY94_03535 [Candidatus Kaiserbacteria bacterium]|nr:hypothetical protein [Candidatus Kaiserbacteria bacterium]